MSAVSFQQIPVKDLDHIEFLEESTDDVQRIYLIRHGESVLNVPDAKGIKYVQGKSKDVFLSKMGVLQAQELAKKLAPKIKSPYSCAFLSSTALRAQKTAIPLMQQLGISPYFLRRFEELCELGSGKWEKTSKENPEYVKDYSVWKKLSAKEKFVAPKVSTGESYREVAERALGALLTFSQRQKKTMLVFSHTMLMNALVIQLTHPPLSESPASSLPDQDFKNGDILMIEIKDKICQIKTVIRSIHK